MTRKQSFLVSFFFFIEWLKLSITLLVIAPAPSGDWIEPFSKKSIESENLQVGQTKMKWSLICTLKMRDYLTHQWFSFNKVGLFFHEANKEKQILCLDGAPNEGKCCFSPFINRDKLIEAAITLPRTKLCSWMKL